MHTQDHLGHGRELQPASPQATGDLLQDRLLTRAVLRLSLQSFDGRTQLLRAVRRWRTRLDLTAQVDRALGLVRVEKQLLWRL
jgi:hypothetical protein